MQSDINSPKSKSFNIFLRFFQLTLSLAATVFVTELVEKTCASPVYRVIQIVVGVGLLLSIIGLITLKCATKHPKIGFIVLFVLSLAAVAGVVGLTMKEMIWGDECAVSGVFYHYYLGAIALFAIIVLMILLLPLLWVQRYSNSPGNIIWAFFLLKVVLQWVTPFRWTILALAGAILIQSLFTLVINIVAGFKGVTTTVKSWMKCAWLFDLILILGTQVITILIYMNGREGGHFQGFDGTQTRVVLQAFMLINLIDLLFWLFGLQALNYENGDSVRDELVKFGIDPTFDQQSDVQDYDPKANYGQIA